MSLDHAIPADLDRAWVMAELCKAERILLQYVRERTWAAVGAKQAKPSGCTIDFVALGRAVNMRPAYLNHCRGELVSDGFLIQDHALFSIGRDVRLWIKAGRLKADLLPLIVDGYEISTAQAPRVPGGSR